MTDTRRRFLGLAAAAGAALPAACSLHGQPEGTLRPPGALDESDFLALCIRCARCGPVCPTGAVRFGDSLGPSGSTPYVDTAERACVLCMRCNEVCPTGALKPIPVERDVIAAEVRIGVAKIDENMCWAFRSRSVCRACWYACPYPDEAIELDGDLRPHVIDERCVGCGLCQVACPGDPGTLVVKPVSIA